MAYVALTRGRRNNEVFLYQKFSQEADCEHAQPISSPALHQLRRGNKYSAEHYFKQILHNDDRPRTMNAEAQRTDPALLPEAVADVIGRHQDPPPHAHGRLARKHENRADLAGRLRTDDRRGSNPRRWHRPRRRWTRAMNGLGGAPARRDATTLLTATVATRAQHVARRGL